MMKIRSFFYFIIAVLLSSCCYKQNEEKKEGEVTEFYANGKLKSKINYSSGKKNGFSTWYYPDGQIQKQSDFSDDHPVGATRYYSRDGNIQIYSFYNLLGDLVYVKEFNSIGGIIKEEGSPLNIAYISPDNLNYIKVGEAVKFYANLANPPGSIVNLSISEYEDGGELVTKVEKTYQDSLLYFQFSYKDSGLKKLIAIAELVDTINNSTYTDSINMKWNIIE